MLNRHKIAPERLIAHEKIARPVALSSGWSVTAGGLFFHRGLKSYHFYWYHCLY
jgi:hypothetical protein